jgi:hypothetical protein
VVCYDKRVPFYDKNKDGVWLRIIVEVLHKNSSRSLLKDSSRNLVMNSIWGMRRDDGERAQQNEASDCPWL